MIAPVFSTGCQIKTLDQKGKPAELVQIRFFWHEPLGKDEKGIDRFQAFVISSVVMPRTAAKAVAKQWLQVLAREDEHGGPGG